MNILIPGFSLSFDSGDVPPNCQMGALSFCQDDYALDNWYASTLVAIYDLFEIGWPYGFG